MAQQAYYQTPGHVIAASTVLPVLDILAVGLRFYARRKQRLAIAIDDWLTLPAVLLIIGSGAALIAGVALHAVAYPTPALVNDMTKTYYLISVTLQVEWAFYLMSIPALGLIKLSFLFFYRRIFCTHKKKGPASWVIMAMIVLTIVWTICFFFTDLFACGTSFSHFWGSPLDLETCIRTEEFTWALSMSDFIMDVLIIIIPIPLVWQLHLQTSRKVGVISIFLLGLVAVAASMTRFIYMAKAICSSVAACPERIDVDNSVDSLDANVDEDLLLTLPLYWGMVEASLGLLAACLPSLRSLFDGSPVESMVAGLRGRFSLQSLRNRNDSGNDSRSSRYIVGNEKSTNLREQSAASHARIVRPVSEELTDFEDV